MNRKIKHVQLYAPQVTPHILSLVRGELFEELMREGAMELHHENYIELDVWDRLADHIKYAATELSQRVCILKEAAQQIILKERQKDLHVLIDWISNGEEWDPPKPPEDFPSPPPIG